MPLLTILRNAAAGALDLIAPPRGTEALVRELGAGELRRLAARQFAPYAPAIRSLLPYRDPSVRALIYELKYRQNARAALLAAELLGEELMGAGEEWIGTPLLIPVPMHPERRKARGINPPEMVATYIRSGAQSAVEYAPQALRRVRLGKPQQQLRRKKRLSNMQGAMAADPGAVRGRICIVIDDVTTTGATLMECRRALKEAGAKEIHLLAIAG